jgi:hypothetical protein
MAGTYLILLRDGVERVLDGLLASGSKIAVSRSYRERRYDVVEPRKYDCLLEGKLVQLFVKNPSFSSVDFRMYPVGEKDGEAYVVDQLAWDGHLSITVVAPFGSTPPIFRLSIIRQSFSFLIETNEYFKFSHEIDEFYKSLARLARRGTKRTQVNSIYYWVDKGIFDLGDEAMQRISAWHRGPNQIKH